MPELPEVEVGARLLKAALVGKKIVRAKFAISRVLKGAGPQAAAKLVAGRTVEEVERRGKWVRIALSGGAAIFSHFGMTGKWLLRSPNDATERFERGRLDLARASVRYRDPRVLGQLVISRDGTAPKAWRALGPDPLHDGVDAKRLYEKFQRTHQSIKETLLDQRVAAGVGNIQAAETLWRAKIDPRKPADAIDRAQAKKIARAIVDSIQFTLALQEGPEITYVEEGAENPFKVYGRKGEPCPRCKTKLVRIEQGGRGTVFCPRCQRA